MVKYGKIYPVSFGFAWGVVGGIGWMLTCWMGARWGWGIPLTNLVSSVYYHLAPTFVGGFWGLFWGFLDFFIFGLFVAIIYNSSCQCFCPAGSCEPCDSK